MISGHRRERRGRPYVAGALVSTVVLMLVAGGCGDGGGPGATVTPTAVEAGGSAGPTGTPTGTPPQGTPEPTISPTATQGPRTPVPTERPTAVRPANTPSPTLTPTATQPVNTVGPTATPTVSAPAGTPGPTLPTREITVTGGGGRTAALTVELATTRAERELGLMFRESLPEERGMLFVFAADEETGFWMENTLIPLSIAYLDDAGEVLEIHDGRPLDETVLWPSRPYRYALEVNQGWFERHGLGVGATVSLPKDLPAAE